MLDKMNKVRLPIFCARSLQILVALLFLLVLGLPVLEFPLAFQQYRSKHDWQTPAL